MIRFESLGFNIGVGEGEQYSGIISERAGVVFPAIAEALRAIDATYETFSPEYYKSIESASRHFPRYPLEDYAVPGTLFDTVTSKEEPGNPADFIDFLTSADDPEVPPREIVNSSNGIVENPDRSVNLAAARRKANACSMPGHLVMIGTPDRPTVVKEQIVDADKPTVVKEQIVDAEAADNQFALAA